MINITKIIEWIKNLFRKEKFKPLPSLEPKEKIVVPVVEEKLVFKEAIIELEITALKRVSLNSLTPTLYEKLKEFYRRALGIGIPIIVTCTDRTKLMQRALFAQGRESFAKTNNLRKQAGMYLISEKENSYKVTWTHKSKHIPKRPGGLVTAFDIAVLYEGKPIWTKVNVNNNEVPDYEELAQIGRDLGLRCGADFKNPDWVHFEEV